MAELTISIDRTGMVGDPDPLVMTGHADPTRFLSVSDYQEPGTQPRTNNAPDGDDHGSVPLSWAWIDSILGFNAFYEEGASESEMRSRIAELTAAVSRLRYETTVILSDAPAETWICRPGSVVPTGGRTRTDMRLFNPVWSVALPVHPVRSVA